MDTKVNFAKSHLSTFRPNQTASPRAVPWVPDVATMVEMTGKALQEVVPRPPSTPCLTRRGQRLVFAQAATKCPWRVAEARAMRYPAKRAARVAGRSGVDRGRLRGTGSDTCCAPAARERAWRTAVRVGGVRFGKFLLAFDRLSVNDPMPGDPGRRKERKAQVWMRARRQV